MKRTGSKRPLGTGYRRALVFAENHAERHDQPFQRDDTRPSRNPLSARKPTRRSSGESSAPCPPLGRHLAVDTATYRRAQVWDRTFGVTHLVAALDGRPIAHIDGYVRHIVAWLGHHTDR
ncbi:hypothetical protein SAMN05421505_11862 [Sinosporangium album]|uniref:Uncharacterized protein n=1 Tax=Sinosporangium album TaxID=504805 RepID=A0A1G8DI82_9ACTN|nr:hypothetical protein [Sinosporangium album]SDH57364.1 hypothetical protein SAMN05421505_11862 [Sinosporangium album]